MLAATRESLSSNKDPAQPKINKIIFKKIILQWVRFQQESERKYAKSTLPAEDGKDGV